MKAFTGLAAVVAGLAILASCADDIVLEEPPSLKGSYKGTYTFRLISTAQTKEENILWRFDDRAFFMNLDSSNFTGMCFCSCYGEYVMESGVSLSVIGSQPDGSVETCTSCNQALNPEGVFVLDQSTAVLKLTRQSGDTVRQLLLTRIVQ
jgi:hypothetical protein